MVLFCLFRFVIVVLEAAKIQVSFIVPFLHCLTWDENDSCVEILLSYCDYVFNKCMDL